MYLSFEIVTWVVLYEHIRVILLKLVQLDVRENKIYDFKIGSKDELRKIILQK